MIVIKLENGLMKHWKLMKIFVPNSYFSHYDFFEKILPFALCSELASHVFCGFCVLLYGDICYQEFSNNWTVFLRDIFCTEMSRFSLVLWKTGGKSTKVSLLLFQLPSVIKKTFWIVNITVLLKTPFAVRRKNSRKISLLKCCFWSPPLLEYFKKTHKDTPCQNLNLGSEIDRDFFFCKMSFSGLMNNSRWPENVFL